MSKRVVVLASINTDITATTSRLPAKGETVEGYSIDMFGGGKGANQSIQCAQLGLDTRIVGLVGTDMQGDFVQKSLTAGKVDLRHLRVSEAFRTGCTSINIDPQGDNTIVYAPGANHHITREMIDDAMEDIAQAQVFLTQTEVNLDAVAYGLARAHEAGVTTILNPAPALPLPEELFGAVDFLTPNETESEVYTGILRSEMPLTEWKHRTVEWFLNKGVKNLCITMGEKGAFYSDGTTYLDVPAYSIRPVDTTAAGDAFHGGLAYGLAYGLPMEETLRLGNACGAMAALTLGAQNSIRDLAAIQEFMKKAEG